MLGTRLRKLREQRGWSQAELAEIAGLAQTYVSELERGSRSNPSREIIQSLATALDVPVVELAEAAWRNDENNEDTEQVDSGEDELAVLRTVWKELAPAEKQAVFKLLRGVARTWSGLSSRERAAVLHLTSLLAGKD